MSKQSKITLIIVLIIVVLTFIISNKKILMDNHAESQEASAVVNSQVSSIPSEVEVREVEMPTAEKVSNGLVEVGTVDLGEDYSAYVTLDVADNRISNIFFNLMYQEEEPLLNQQINGNTVCSEDDSSFDCDYEKISISLNNIGLWLQCNGTFPEEKWYLTDEQYDIVKQAYTRIVDSGDFNQYSFSDKCVVAYDDVY